MTRGLYHLRPRILNVVLLLTARWSEVYVRLLHDLQYLLLLRLLSAFEGALQLLDGHDLMVALVDLIMELAVLRVV